MGKWEKAAVCAAPIALIFAAFYVQYTKIDVGLASLFYDAEAGTWPLRDHWLVRGILHDGAQSLTKALGAAFLAFIVAKAIRRNGNGTPKRLGVTFLALLLGPLLVGCLKSVTHLACPWDETLFGGSVAHIRLFDTVPFGTPVGHGFPAAHASSGYAFSALYFAAALFAPRHRMKALIASLFLGALFGFAQQARGAHFLSHDLVALSICWSSAGVVFATFYSKQLIKIFGYTSKKIPGNAIYHA